MRRNGKTNFGDCILIDTGTSLVIFDCGHQKHAERVLAYMKKEGYKEAEFILSHNDSDHFDGLPCLIEAGVISHVYTLLLLKEKYRKKLLQIMGNYIKDECSLVNDVRPRKCERVSRLGRRFC